VFDLANVEAFYTNKVFLKEHLNIEKPEQSTLALTNSIMSLQPWNRNGMLKVDLGSRLVSPPVDGKHLSLSSSCSAVLIMSVP